MKKILFILLISFSAVQCFSQNLVSNPSFEIYDTCPYNQNQIHFATGWENYSSYSPDYFNSCSTNPLFSVPYNWGGYQQAADGIAYAGIYTFETPQTPPDTALREFIGTQLISQLVIGTKYYISFKVNLALDINHTFNQATNNLGILFSTIPYSSINPFIPHNFAHFYCSSVITDTLNWTNISGSFVADSAYQYIVIGNFFDDAHTTVIQMQDTFIDRSAYYYIDDIYVSTDSLDGITEQIMQDMIKVYPNPFTQSTTIELNCNYPFKYTQLTIYNAFGNRVKKYPFVEKKIKIDRENLPDGIYFLNLEINDKTFTQKLIIQ